MLASCYRKLADMRKFAKDFERARNLYLEAISIGQRLMAAEPGNTEFQEHLATALHDLAGVLFRIGKPAEARSLLERAEKVCSRLVASDPESVESQARLVFVLTDLGRIARDESKFAAASDSFQRAGEVLRGLMSRGKLEAWPGLDSRYLENLREEVEECREAPLAFGALGAIRPRPAGEAIQLLKTRARLLAARGRWPEFVATVVALRDLEPKLAEDLYAQARGLGLFLACLNDDARPGPPPPGPGTAPSELRRKIPGCPEPRRGAWLPRPSAHRGGRHSCPGPPAPGLSRTGRPAQGRAVPAAAPGRPGRLRRAVRSAGFSAISRGCNPSHLPDARRRRCSPDARNCC